MLSMQLWLLWYLIHFSIFILSKVIRYNLIIGKWYGGHLVFMQIRRLMKEDICFLQTNITKLFPRSPFAKKTPLQLPSNMLWDCIIKYIKR